MNDEYVVGRRQRILDGLDDVEHRLRRGDADNLTRRKVVTARIVAWKLLMELEPQDCDGPDRPASGRQRAIAVPLRERETGSTGHQCGVPVVDGC